METQVVDESEVIEGDDDCQYESEQLSISTEKSEAEVFKQKINWKEAYGPISKECNSRYRDGHTYRRADQYYHHKDIIISRSNATSSIDGGSAIPVTELDEYFDQGFYGSRFSRTRPLKSRELLEELLTVLEDNTIKVVNEYRHSYCDTILHYDVPVIGHIMHQTLQNDEIGYQAERRNVKVSKRINKDWLCWQGKYFDPTYIYSVQYCPHSSNKWKIQAVCLSNTSALYKEMTRLGPTDDGQRNRIAFKEFYEKKESQAYLDIDLGCLYELTHIGMMGGYPHHGTRQFPDYNDLSFIKVNGVKRWKKNSRFIYVTKDGHELSWVTDYHIAYRDLQTRKWRPYSNDGVKGCYNLQDEVVSNISLIARYIRIIPIDAHNNKDMRVFLYGSTVSHSKIALSRKAALQNERDLQRQTASVNSQYIRYTIEPRNVDRYHRDGHGGSACSCCRCMWEDTKGKRRQLKKFARDELKYYTKDNS